MVGDYKNYKQSSDVTSVGNRRKPITMPGDEGVSAVLNNDASSINTDDTKRLQAAYAASKVENKDTYKYKPKSDVTRITTQPQTCYTDPSTGKQFCYGLR